MMPSVFPKQGVTRGTLINEENDQKTNQYHGVLSSNYYEKALKILSEKIGEKDIAARYKKYFDTLAKNAPKDWPAVPLNLQFIVSGGSPSSP